MSLVSPYKNIEQHTKILIEPHQMNSDIRNHLKFNLKKKVEKKCNNNGYVHEIYKINTYSDGMMIPEYLSGSAIYNVTYHCKICIPIEKSIIIGQVKVINQELVVAINGPIIIFIPKDNIDSTIWNISDNFSYNKDPNKKLLIGNFVCIQVLNKRINRNDTQIKMIGKLLDIASEKDVEKFYGNTITENDSSNFI
jgi:DNA-directed RNA polymerase subunit E'/Rpb7